MHRDLSHTHTHTQTQAHTHTHTNFFLDGFTFLVAFGIFPMVLLSYIELHTPPLIASSFYLHS